MAAVASVAHDGGALLSVDATFATPVLQRPLESGADMRVHCAGAQVVAEFLAADPRVAYVAHPGLDSHPQHALAARTLDGGFGGMLAFAARGDPDTQNRFVAHLELITSAVSLGHDETLIVHVGAGGGTCGSRSGWRTRATWWPTWSGR